MRWLHYHEVERPRGRYLLDMPRLRHHPSTGEVEVIDARRDIWPVCPAQMAIWEHYREDEAFGMVVGYLDAMYAEWWREPTPAGGSLAERIRRDFARGSPGHSSRDGWSFQASAGRFKADFGRHSFTWTIARVAKAIAARRQPAPAKLRQMAMF